MKTRRLPVLSILFVALMVAGTTEAATFGARTDYAAGGGPAGFATADLNRDGRLDLVVANLQTDSISLFVGVEGGSFATATHYATGDGPLSVAVGDLDSDGALDVATANTIGSTVSILLGNGDGTLGTRSDYATGNNPAGVCSPTSTWMAHPTC